MKKVAWFEFQENIKAFFISMGFDANTNVAIKGIRTVHKIDVHVKSKFLSQDVVWIVEAKHWKTNVDQNHVLALRTIVDDIGADKGFIISSSGFQSGAVKACRKTNITLLTFDELVQLTNDFNQEEILKSYESRIKIIERRYWAHSKDIRIDYGLRGERAETIIDYNVNFIVDRAKYAITKAKEHQYPIDMDVSTLEKYGSLRVENLQQLINWLNLNLNTAESKIFEAEVLMQKNNEFNPKLSKK